VVLAGILTIAIADAFSDALGIHVLEEAVNTNTTKQIWVATIATFLTKFLFAITFIVPVLLLTLSTAIVVSLIWGLSVLQRKLNHKETQEGYSWRALFYSPPFFWYSTMS